MKHLLLSLLLLTGAPARAEPAISVDPASTAVRVSVDSFILPVKGGSFSDVKGRIHLDFARPERSHMAVTIDARKLEAGAPRYNAFLRGPSIFNVDQHPTMTFVSRRMTALGEGRARFEGMLTLRGIARPLAVNVVVARDATQPATPRFTARGKINRLDFGIDRGYPLVTAMVDFVLTTQPPADE